MHFFIVYEKVDGFVVDRTYFKTLQAAEEYAKEINTRFQEEGCYSKYTMAHVGSGRFEDD